MICTFPGMGNRPDMLARDGRIECLPFLANTRRGGTSGPFSGGGGPLCRKRVSSITRENPDGNKPKLPTSQSLVGRSCRSPLGLSLPWTYLVAFSSIARMAVSPTRMSMATVRVPAGHVLPVSSSFTAEACGKRTDFRPVSLAWMPMKPFPA